MKSPDCIRVTTIVAVDAATAFAVFTADIGLWWRRDLRHGLQPRPNGNLRFEAPPDGRLVEIGADGEVFEVGRVHAWQPGERLVFGWRNRAFAAGERTEVEVRFEPVTQGTRVTLEHRGWDSLRSDHPARLGLGEPAFSTQIGRFWAERLVDVNARCQTRRG
jgi:uncharacterized protein YndB with AHSA1/START domain